MQILSHLIVSLVGGDSIRHFAGSLRSNPQNHATNQDPQEDR